MIRWICAEGHIHEGRRQLTWRGDFYTCDICESVRSYDDRVILTLDELVMASPLPPALCTPTENKGE